MFVICIVSNMFIEFCKLHFFIFVIIILVKIVLHFACAASIITDHEVKSSNNEVNDLNQMKAENYIGIFQPVHIHQDDSVSKINLSEIDIYSTLDYQNNLKYDAEILEDTPVEREDIEREEFYRGPSLILNLDKLIDDNIEVTFRQHKTHNDLNVTFIMLIVTLFLIITVVAVILYRKQIVQQAAFGELLVTTNNRDFCTDKLLSSQHVI